MRRYLHADANLYSHIVTLRSISVILSICLIGALLGWHHAARVQRISIPPDIRYGSQVSLNTINPWEVYNFAGYVWQQINRCPHDCFRDYPQNLERLTRFLTPEFKAWLRHDSEKRAAELLGRSRYLLPLETTNFREAVSLTDSGTWNVTIDVELKEAIGGVSVKDAKIRYYLTVVSKSIDPEFNPWGLLLDTMSKMPDRILPSQS